MDEKKAPVDETSLLGERVVAQLRMVYDPEIPVNVYDLGLIYAIDIKTKENDLFDVTITMTLTTPNCPIADQIPVNVRQAVEDAKGADNVTVNLVWDPPWDPSRLSDEARMQLDMF